MPPDADEQHKPSGVPFTTLATSGGFNDLRFLTKDGQIPTIGNGNQGERSHCDDEAVSPEELAAVTGVDAGLAMSIPNVRGSESPMGRSINMSRGFTAWLQR